MTTPRDNSTTETNTLALLVFTIGEQLYGIPVTSVVRIIEMVTITHLPGAPDTIKGIINLHGNTVPVIDLRHRFNASDQNYGLNTPIILVNINGSEQILGLVVDSVNNVIHVPHSNLEMFEIVMPANLAKQITTQANYLAGITKFEGQIILILNVKAILTHTEQADLSKALDTQ